MQDKNKTNKNIFRSGFSLVEVLLTIAIFAMLITTFSSSLIYGQESERLSGDRARATFLAEEGLEAVRSMRDGNFSDLAAGTHGLAISENKWIFSGSSDATDIFTREIIVVDNGVAEKIITANVFWKQNEQRNGLISLETRLNNWRIANPTEAQQLAVNTNSSQIESGGTFQVSNIDIENIGIEDVTIASMQVSWSGVSSGANLVGISMDGNSVWTGSDATGSLQDISDFTVALAGGTYPLVFIFDKTVNGISFDVTFIMTDGFTKEVIFKPGSPIDMVAPTAINNLTTSNPTTTAIDLSWTATGDDGMVGTATAYDIRYSTNSITSANWETAIQVSGEPVPLSSGSNQNMTITGLSLGTTYYFAMKASDEVPNHSEVSNVASGATNALPQASYLIVDTSGVLLSTGKTDILGIALQNSGPASIVVNSITVSWSGVAVSRRLRFIQIDGVNVWNGSVVSGTTNDIEPDVLLNTGAVAIPVNYLRFNNTVSNIVLSLTFNMSDGSTKTVSGIGPLL